MTYRTKTYLAADWSGDKNVVDEIYKWNESEYWSLHFVDAHDLTQARDTSLYCSIKKSLAERLDASKTFVLIVGDQTKTLTKGSCANCGSYNSWSKNCARGGFVDYRSYITYECEKANLDGLRIVVIYNGTTVRREKCPTVLQNKGEHLSAFYYGPNGIKRWNYQKIKDAIMGN